MNRKPKPYSLTKKHKAKLKAWNDEHGIAVAMRTKQLTVTERKSVVGAIYGLYRAANLPAPVNVVFSGGPITAAIAAGISAGVWYLRDNPGAHVALFGRVVGEAELMAAIPAACGRAISAAIGSLEFGPLVATRAATDAATYSATDATRAATRAATDAATYSATSDATRAATYSASNGGLVWFLVACISGWAKLKNGGNQWAGWVSYISFFRYVAKLKIDYSKWAPYEIASVAGPRFMHEKFTIISELPVTLGVDEQHRPHCANGPSHQWADGVYLYYWHGIRVPGDWIESPSTLDPKTAMTWQNIEQRRAAAEIIGWDRVVSACGGRIVDKDIDPQIGELLEVDLPNSPRQKFLRVRCGTGRQFCLPVPPTVTTALAANAWTYAIEDVSDLTRFRNFAART